MLQEEQHSQGSDDDMPRGRGRKREKLDADDTYADFDDLDLDGVDPSATREEYDSEEDKPVSTLIANQFLETSNDDRARKAKD